VTSLGGTIDSRQENQLIVTIPPGALAALKSDPKVRYVERVGRAGNIVSISTDTYLYDGVQRLKQSSTQVTPETYTYDGLGNMTARTNNGNAQMIPGVDTNTNRWSGALCYDYYFASFPRTRVKLPLS
jgi:YD repeat-containing protein